MQYERSPEDGFASLTGCISPSALRTNAPSPKSLHQQEVELAEDWRVAQEGAWATLTKAVFFATAQRACICSPLEMTAVRSLEAPFCLSDSSLMAMYAVELTANLYVRDLKGQVLAKELALARGGAHWS